MSVRKYPNSPCPHDDSIPVLELPDGRLAEITQWGIYSTHIGRHVQRSGGRIVTIGKASSYWVRNELMQFSDPSKLRVRILPDGYLLEVVNNQPE